MYNTLIPPFTYKYHYQFITRLMNTEQDKEAVQKWILPIFTIASMPNLCICQCFPYKNPNLSIGQFHVRIQECIKALIVVTSWLNAVVACVNVLDPMENQWCAAFKLMLQFKYTVYVNFANNNGKMIKFHTL